MDNNWPTLFDLEPREVPSMPEEIKGKVGVGCSYTLSKPREWNDEEIAWLRDMKEKGFTLSEIAESMGRTEASISIKLKRLGKTNEKYNDAHRQEKYAANLEFLNAYKPHTILDAYCGTEKWWLKNVKGGGGRLSATMPI